MDGGLKTKYIVRKADTGEAVENCFVLRPEKDPAAVAAIRAYAEATDNNALAADLLRWIGKPDVPLTLDELRGMEGKRVYIVEEESGAYAFVCDTRQEIWGFDTLKGYALFYSKYYGKSWLAYRCKPEDG